jgi:hypothetical protein
VTRCIPLVLCLALAGCAGIVLSGPVITGATAGGIMTGGAALLNADVSAGEAIVSGIERYVAWRKASTVPVTSVVGAP